MNAQSDTVRLAVMQGWNLISLPLIVPDERTSILFQTAISKAYTYQSGYVAQETPRHGVGYWIKFPAAETIAIAGNMLLNDTIALRVGWNMVGTVGIPIATSAVTTTPPNIIISNYYSFHPDGGYQIVDTLLPGKGYWVKASQAGTIQQYLCDNAVQLLIIPLANEGTTLTPTLTWRRSYCSILYHLQLAVDSTLTTLIVDTLTSDTSYQLDTLERVKDYYWRVGLPLSNGVTAWSPTQSFTTLWEYVGLKTEVVGSPLFDWSNPNVMYAGSGSNYSTGQVGGIFKSTDSGATWDTLMRGVTPYGLTMHPYDPNIIYATLGLNFLTSSGILKTTDAGATWARADSGIYMDFDTGPSGVSIDPQHPETLWTGTGGAFSGPLYRSTNGGRYWRDFNNNLPLGGNPIEINPINTNILYAQIYYSQWLYKTTDAGITWDRILDSQQVNDLKLNFRFPDSMYTATDSGIYISSDGGSTWRASNNGFPKAAFLRTGGIVMDPSNPYNLYVILKIPPTFISKTYKTSNGGQLWELLPTPTAPDLEPYLWVGSISLHGSKLYTGSRSGIYKYLR